MSKEDVKIVERVKFWEEQDKINQVLIPRVLDMHEQLKTTSLLSQQNSSSYVQTISSLKNLEDKLNKEIDNIVNDIDIIEKNINDLSAQLKSRFQEQQEDNKKLSQLFDVTMQDIDTRYKGLIVSITELRELINQKHAEIMLDIEKELKQYNSKMEQLTNQIKIIADKNEQYALLHTTISQKLDKLQKENENLNLKIIDKNKEIKQQLEQQQKENQELRKQIDVLKYSKSNDLQNIQNKLSNELSDLQEYHDEQSSKQKTMVMIAIGLAVLSMIISLFKG